MMLQITAIRAKQNSYVLLINVTAREIVFYLVSESKSWALFVCGVFEITHFALVPHRCPYISHFLTRFIIQLLSYVSFD